jgi:hypothetical protein
LLRTEPDEEHRCYAQLPPAAIDVEHQRAFCLTSEHVNCPFFIHPNRAEPLLEDNEDDHIWQMVYWGVIAVILLIVAVIYGRTLLFSPKIAETPVATLSSAPAATVPTLVPTILPTPIPVVAPPELTPTPEPGGRILTLRPDADDVAWWDSQEAVRAHAGDSFLYAGYFHGRVFLSAFRLDLSRVPRGAPIREAELSLTGLQTERFDPQAGGQWTVQILQPDAIEDWPRIDFQTALNAPAAITLVPSLTPDQLAKGAVNRWKLDASALTWIEKTLEDGHDSLIFRIIGSTGGASTLFGWDSGSGPESLGEPPRLMLNVGPPPATPPPLPTQAFIVATLTPTPANVLTVAANSLTATAVARTIGTYTPEPPNIATPTPTAANLATIQALAFQLGLPPVVPPTPFPLNDATATAQAVYATAVALVTGTFTPTPENAVTPVYLTLTPTPENLETAVAIVLQATEQARTATPTPWPYNVLAPTPTWTPWFVTATPTPLNDATATAESFYATAVALTTGTPTPLPPNAVVLPYGVVSTPVPHAFVTGQQALISDEGTVWVHAVPDVDGRIINSLEPGAEVTIVGGPYFSGHHIWWRVWWRIRFAAESGFLREGWVRNEQLAPP